MRGLFLLTLTAALTLLLLAPVPRALRWWKGNTHTHTLWSDGDAAPEHVVAAYRKLGHHFLVLSDHNVVQDQERWVPTGTKRGQVSPAYLEELVREHGAEVREGPGGRELRLRTLDELRTRFEAPGFILIPGEEISDSVDRLPLHHNSMNHSHLIKPAGGTSMRDAMERTIKAVEEASREAGKPMLVHLNHPNFHWAVSPDDVAHVLGERYFEVYNGHQGVRNYGDADHPGTEAMWDYVLTLRLSKLGGDVLFGLATDDAHNYHGDKNTSVPGRGWIWVRAPELTPDGIVRAMQRGDFYASSGVRLRDVVAGRGSLSVVIEAEPGVSYETLFIGTRRGSAAKGEVLARVRGPWASYAFRGDELYVRAVVRSSRLHPNGYEAGDLETAWTQPVRPQP